MKTLVIGGSGSTGVPVLEGLLRRGHDVTMLHRGVHEPDGLPDVPHIHADPHFPDTLTEAIGGTQYDLVLAMYGRVAAITEVFAGRCGHLISIGGVPAYRGCLQAAKVHPYGMAINQSHPEFVRFVNAVLDQMRADGKWTQIYNTWLSGLGPAPAPPPAVYQG